MLQQSRAYVCHFVCVQKEVQEFQTVFEVAWQFRLSLTMVVYEKIYLKNR